VGLGNSDVGNRHESHHNNEVRLRAIKVLRVLAVVTIFYVCACFYLAYNYIHPSRIMPIRPLDLFEVQVPWIGHDADLAWSTRNLANGHPGDIVIVFAHGYGGDRSTRSQLMSSLAQEGIDMVSPAMPGQDASPQSSVGFGITEAATLLRTAEWVRSMNPRVKIVYMGVSMGGSAAWLASEQDPKAVGVISEGAYARFDQAMDRFFESKAPGASIYLKPVVWMASAMSGIDPSSIVPLNAAKKWCGRSALVIQAGNDQLILRDHADRLAKASGADEWIVPGAEHAGCYSQAPEEYLSRVLTFVHRL
jgi:pimeloyl-ACP methyl ester carboxylesterase